MVSFEALNLQMHKILQSYVKNLKTTAKLNLLQIYILYA